MSHVECPIPPVAGTLNSPVFWDSLSWILLEFSRVIIDDSPWARWLWRLLKATTGTSLSYATFQRLWYDCYVVPTCFFREPCEGALKAVLSALKVPTTLADEMSLAAMAKRRTFEESEHAVPGVRETLHKIRSLGYCVALLAICDCSDSHLERRLGRAQLNGLFDRVIQPDANLSVARCLDKSVVEGWWHHIPKLLHCVPQEIVFLSAFAPHLAAARRAGMHAVGIDIEGEPWDGPRVACLHELLRHTPERKKRLAV